MDYNSQERPAPPRMRRAPSWHPLLPSPHPRRRAVEGGGLRLPACTAAARAWAVRPAAILARGSAAAATKQTRERHRGGEEGPCRRRSLSMCQARPGRWVPLPGSPAGPLRLARGAFLPSGRGAASPSSPGRRGPAAPSRARGRRAAPRPPPSLQAAPVVKQRPPPAFSPSLPPTNGGPGGGRPPSPAGTEGRGVPGWRLPPAALTTDPLSLQPGAGRCDGAGAFVPGASPSLLPPSPLCRALPGERGAAAGWHKPALPARLRLLFFVCFYFSLFIIFFSL